MCRCGHEKDVHARYSDDIAYCEVEGCHCPWFEEEDKDKDDASTFAP